MKRTHLLVAAGVLASLSTLPWAVTALTPTPAGTMMAAANQWRGSLTPDQKKKGEWNFDDATRTDWHFIPKPRTGLPFKEMTARQRELAQALLKTGVSEHGFSKATQIMDLENVLAAIEKDPVKRDQEKYYFWVFGSPAAKGIWGWRVEGHHVSLNFTVVDGTLLATTPQFLGSNPGEVMDGPLKGRRVLGVEEDLGRELLLSFDDKARAQVIFDAKAPAEVVSGASQKVKPLAPAGVAAGTMNAKQKALLRKLLGEFASAMPESLAGERLAKVDKAGFDKAFFAWAGGMKRGEPHYYRVQGPTFLIEYDNTQNNANHIHTVWRDFDGDFGRDLISEHLKNAH